MTRNALCVTVLLLLSACAGSGATETLSGNGLEWVRIEGGARDSNILAGWDAPQSANAFDWVSVRYGC